MAQDGSPRPRRALEPLPDGPDDAPSGGRFAAPPDDPSPTSTGLRRLAASPQSPVSPVDPMEVPPHTPVPPPAPVLPEPEAALPASAGRRFSASAEPSEFVPAAPRRSAVSATSPASAIEPILPPAPRPSAPPEGATNSLTTFTPGPRTPLPQVSPAASASAPSPVPAGPAMVPPDQALPGSSVPPVEPGDAAAPVRQGWFGRKRPAADDTLAAQPDATAPAAATPTADVPVATTADVPVAGPEKASKPEKPAKAPKPPKPEKPSRKDRRAPKPVATTVPAAAGEAAAADVPAVDVPAVKPASRRSSRPALLIMASVLAVALLVAAAVWLLTLRSNAPSGAPTTSATASALDPLVSAADLGTLGGATWVESTATNDGVRPLCLPADGAGLPNAQRSVSRRTTASSSQVDAFVQVVDTYTDDAAATQAFTVRLAQAGTCGDATAWITSSSLVTGLADAAQAVRLVVQDQASVFHTVLVSRTGRTVSLADITTGEAAVNALDLAGAVGKALSRQCGGDLGTCPASVAVASVPPPAGDPSGWLVEADLPRVTPGSGRWGATDPFSPLTVLGSQCEAIDLTAVTGAASSGQRTLLLADDANAPKGFGVDMATYTFGAEKDASALADKLTSNIAKCPDRAPTATIKEGPAVKGNGESGARVTGSTFLVTQKTETTTVLYRVAVVTVGSKVVYLLGNPTTGFDFTDSQWKTIAVRAGQRATQA